MTTKIQFFNHEKFGEIRMMLDEKGQPWFFGKDVARRLGYTNPQKALRDHVDNSDKGGHDSFTVNGTQPILINESGVYQLILKSKLPQAKVFKHWVTSDVLPQIRQTGGYIPLKDKEGKVISDLEIVDRAMQIIEKSIKQKELSATECRP